MGLTVETVHRPQIVTTTTKEGLSLRQTRPNSIESSIASLDVKPSEYERGFFSWVFHKISSLWNWLTDWLFCPQEQEQRACCVKARKPMKIEEEAEKLACQFLSLKEKTSKNSSYTVEMVPLDHSALVDHSTLYLNIHLRGSPNQEINQVPLSTLNDKNGCCQTCYEHTFKFEPNVFCNELSSKIKKYGFFAVWSRSGNLLLIPDTFDKSIKPQNYHDLFQLNKNQLQNTFSAILETMNVLKARDPSYVPHITTNSGMPVQEFAILHIRFGRLTQTISNLS
jgi:hypothetical protein